MGPATFHLDTTQSDLVQAASLALALMRTAKTNTWADLTTKPDQLVGVNVPPGQVDLLNRYSGPLTLLRVGPPMVTIAVCPDCGLFTVVAGMVAATCTLTLGCSGSPVRVSAATTAVSKVNARTRKVPRR